MVTLSDMDVQFSVLYDRVVYCVRICTCTVTAVLVSTIKQPRCYPLIARSIVPSDFCTPHVPLQSAILFRVSLFLPPKKSNLKKLGNMSLYNRESVRRHSGVFNRGHPIEDSSNISDTTPTDGTDSTSEKEVGPTSSSTLPTANSTAGLNPSSSPTSSSLHSSPVPSFVTKVVTVPPSPTLGADHSQAQVASKGGLSSGAIGAIVALVILLVAAIVAFAIRKFYIHRREFKRNTWGAGLVPALQTKRNTVYGDEKKASLPAMEQREKNTPPLLTAPNSVGSPKMPSPPPLSYNSIPSPTSALSPIQATSSSKSTTSAQKADFTVVVRTFIPSLPDELNITTGEHIRVLTRYDDGWALCSNMRNEQGVVPLECLQRADKTAALQLQPQSEFGYGSDKSTKRLSSLAPNNNGTY